MSAEHFLDTNILLNMLDETDDSTRGRAEELVRTSIEDGTGCISYQVVQETLNVATRRLGFSARDSWTLLATVLEPLWTVQPSTAMFESGLALRDRHGFSFYDSMIVAGALQSGCNRLYSEDLQDGQRIGPLTVEDPFKTSTNHADSQNC